MTDQTRSYLPLIGAFDPCRPMRVKTYQTPPQLFIGYQPYNLPQFSPSEALRAGTLWPVLYSPYEGKSKLGRGKT
jgi:spore coat protein JA